MKSVLVLTDLYLFLREGIPSEIVEEKAETLLSSDSSFGESDGKSSSPLPPKDYVGYYIFLY